MPGKWLLSLSSIGRTRQGKGDTSHLLQKEKNYNNKQKETLEVFTTVTCKFQVQ